MYGPLEYQGYILRMPNAIREQNNCHYEAKTQKLYINGG